MSDDEHDVDRTMSLGDFYANAMADIDRRAAEQAEDDRQRAEDGRRREEAERQAEADRLAFDTARNAGEAWSDIPDGPGKAPKAKAPGTAEVRHDPMEMRSRVDRAARNKAERGSARLKALADLYSFGPGVEGAAYTAGLVTGAIFCRLVGRSDKSMDKRLDRDTRRALARARKVHGAASKEPGGDARLRDIEGQVRRGAADGVLRPSAAQAKAGAAPKRASRSERDEAKGVMDGAVPPASATGADDVDRIVDLYAKAIDLQRAGVPFDKAQAQVAREAEQDGINVPQAMSRTDEIIDRARAIGRPDIIERSSDPVMMDMDPIEGTHKTIHVSSEPMDARTLGMERDADGNWVRRRADGKMGEKVSGIGCRRLLDLDGFSKRFRSLLDAYHYGNVDPQPTSDSADDVAALLEDMAKPEGERHIFTKDADLNGLRGALRSVHADQQARRGNDMSELADSLLSAGIEHPELLGPEGAALRERVLGPDATRLAQEVSSRTKAKESSLEGWERAGGAAKAPRPMPIVDEASLDRELSRAIGLACADSDHPDGGIDMTRLEEFMGIADPKDKPCGLSEADEAAWRASREVLWAFDQATDSGMDPQVVRERIAHDLDDQVDPATVPSRARERAAAERGDASATMDVSDGDAGDSRGLADADGAGPKGPDDGLAIGG